MKKLIALVAVIAIFVSFSATALAACPLQGLLTNSGSNCGSLQQAIESKLSPQSCFGNLFCGNDTSSCPSNSLFAQLFSRLCMK